MLALATCAAFTASLRVIGAGQGRTGTDSLRLALNELGVGPTYHMSQLLGIDASRPVLLCRPPPEPVRATAAPRRRTRSWSNPHHTHAHAHAHA